MMVVLSPTYTLRVQIKDMMSQQFQGVVMAESIQLGQQIPPPNPHRWFNGVAGKSGCDEVLAAVKEALQKANITATVTLERFEHA